MTIIVTSIRLRKLRYFFQLSWYGFKISQQAKRSKGFIQMKNTGFGYLHFTASLWESHEDALNFSRTGEHLEAMKKGAAIATEVRTYSYEGAQIPGWKEAKKLIEEKGRIILYK